MKANKLHEMNDAELQAKLVDLKTEYFNLRFQNATGQLTNPLKLREVKRDIARCGRALIGGYHGKKSQKDQNR